jgi:hypothetical protein
MMTPYDQILLAPEPTGDEIDGSTSEIDDIVVSPGIDNTKQRD